MTIICTIKTLQIAVADETCQGMHDAALDAARCTTHYRQLSYKIKLIAQQINSNLRIESWNNPAVRVTILVHIP